MDVKNLEDMKKEVKFRGFPEAIAEEAAKRMENGETEFFIEHFAKIQNERMGYDDQMGYRLYFKADEETNKGYFNSFDAGLLEIAGEPGVVREHNFSAHTNITAGESHRMLRHGLLVSVNKDLFKWNKEKKESTPYNTWLSIDINSPKDERGNYPVVSYHENYFTKRFGRPFDIKEALKDTVVPVKELENSKLVDEMDKLMKKAVLFQVTIFHNNQESKGYLSVDPQTAKVDVLNADKKLIENVQVQQKTADTQQQQGPARDTDPEKKKTWGQKQGQGVNWKKSNKGLSAGGV